MDVFVSSTQFWSKGKFWTRKGLYRLGDAFNENQTSELHNSEILKQEKENKKKRVKQLGNFFSNKIFKLLNSVFLFSFFHCKVSELRKLSFEVTV